MIDLDLFYAQAKFDLGFSMWKSESYLFLRNFSELNE